MGTRVPVKHGSPLMISGSILTTDLLTPLNVQWNSETRKRFKKSFARRALDRRSPDKNSEAGQNFPKRMAPEWLGGYELRRLNAFQSCHRLPAFPLEFDPAFQNLTQCLCGLVARFAISPRTGKTAQLGINFRTVVDLLVP